MSDKTRPWRTAAVLSFAGLLFAGAGYSADRKEARDTKQEGRQEARDAKDACKEGDSSRADCRQGKRDDKQEARDQARDVRH